MTDTRWPAGAREAMAKADYEDLYGVGSWEYVPSGRREAFLGNADAILAALRPFVAKMVEAEIRAQGEKVVKLVYDATWLYKDAEEPEAHENGANNEWREYPSVVLNQLRRDLGLADAPPADRRNPNA